MQKAIPGTRWGGFKHDVQIISKMFLFKITQSSNLKHKPAELLTHLWKIANVSKRNKNG